MFKYTLVPKEFFSEGYAAGFLASVTSLEEGSSVKNKELPAYKAVLVYTGEDSRALEIERIVDALSRIDKYNKVVVNIGGGVVDIALAEGRKLLLVNTFPAADDVTAQYFIFAALRQFQINPEVTTVYLYGESSDSIKEDLFRYFYSVESLPVSGPFAV
ncbi:MAG: DUF3822 family protein [Bacteroidales bacterium]|nr:DUF3822 family protein [Candidatus Cacconaster merdequi]